MKLLLSVHGFGGVCLLDLDRSRKLSSPQEWNEFELTGFSLVLQPAWGCWHSFCALINVEPGTQHNNAGLRKIVPWIKKGMIHPSQLSSFALKPHKQTVVQLACGISHFFNENAARVPSQSRGGWWDLPAFFWPFTDLVGRLRSTDGFRGKRGSAGLRGVSALRREVLVLGETALLHLSPPGPSGSCSVHILTGDQSVPAKRDELYFSIIPAAVGKLHKGIRQKAACCWTSG